MRHMDRMIKYLVPLVLFAQFGRESEQDQSKPAVNFRGSITDNTNKTFSADNITIDKLYKQISFYLKPSDATQDPLKNTAELNLVDIQEIRPVFDQEKARTSTFNNRKYVEIIVVRACEPPIENTYVIPASSKLFFYETQNGCPIKRELSFEALKKLIITGHEARETTDHKTKEEIKESTNRKDLQCAQAGKALGELSEKAEKLQDPEKGVFSQLVDKVKDLVGSICSAS